MTITQALEEYAVSLPFGSEARCEVLELKKSHEAQQFGFDIVERWIDFSIKEIEIAGTNLELINPSYNRGFFGNLTVIDKNDLMRLGTARAKVSLAPIELKSALEMIKERMK